MISLAGKYWTKVTGIGPMVALLGVVSASAQSLPSPKDVLAETERVADWQLAHPSAHPTLDWTQGAGADGFLALAGISENPKYREAMVAMGEKNKWEFGNRLYDADNLCIGQTYAELYLLSRENAMIEPLRARCDAILAKPSKVTSLEFGNGGELPRENWSWCDSLFMGPPTWARLSTATGNARYVDFAVKNWWRTTDYLYDREEHLFYRDSTYFQRRESNGKKIFWSRGNGWVLAGLARFLQYLPTNHPDRARFETLFREMAAKIVTCQQSDGLWRSSLLDPDSYPLKETSGSGFYTFALAWGVNQGLLDRKIYSPAVAKAWSALVSCVEPDGRLTHVQPIGADPKHFDANATEVYGVGAFLLAGTEIYRDAVLAAQNPLVIQIKNTAAFYRADETVEILIEKLDRPEKFPQQPAVIDALTSRIIDSQIYQPSSKSAGRKFLFQVNLAPSESRKFLIVDSAQLAAVPTPIVKTFARAVPERMDDFAWESDRIAFRAYGLALIKGEGTISSGIDVWSKSTRKLVVDRWYQLHDYHNDHGEGLDDYHVSRSRGCGGVGIWDGSELYVSRNYRNARVITTGPIRSEFELTYDSFDAAGRQVSETKRVQIDAGSNLNRVESVFESDRSARLKAAVGIAQRPGDAPWQKDQSNGLMTYWQPPDRDRGAIGCAVIVANKVEGFAIDKKTVPQLTPAQLAVPDGEGLPPIANLLAIAPAKMHEPFVYWTGAGWSKSGDFPDAKSWETYVTRYRERLQSPLQISFNDVKY